MLPIALEGVSYAHPSGRRLFDALELAVAPGELLALVGRSGAGKTTILRLINRLILPGEGRVLVAGRETRAWDPIRLRRSIGYVIQEGALFPHLTVAENVAIVPRLEGWDAARITARVEEMLALVGLSAREHGGRWPDELSGGQRQRVGVARALAADPGIVLMDEPFGSLDVMTRADLRREFRQLQRELRKTVVLVTHDIGEALAIADRVAVLDEGRLIDCAAPAALAASPDPRIRRLVESVPVAPPPS